MTAFERERNEIRERIWAFLHLKAGESVLDVGVGHTAYSLNKLIELGCSVTSIDLNFAVLHEYKTPHADFVRCDAACLPFKDKPFILSLANFTFHEIDPFLHEKVVSELGRVSKRIMIVEPVTGEDPVCRRYQEIWTAAMHSMKRFEDYQTMDYWINLLRGCGAKITTTETMHSCVRLRGKEANDYMATVVSNLREEGVSDKYIAEMRKITSDVATKGMVFSDVNVVVGRVQP